MKFYHQPTSANLTARHDFTIELALTSERITLPPNVSLQLVEGPAEPVVVDSELSLTATGRYWLRVTDATGERSDLRLCCFEPALLDWISGQIREIGHGGSDPHVSNEAKVRSIVRSLCVAPAFDGTIDSASSISLANHGA